MTQKIGIATVYKNTNYGANLQAFATYKYVTALGYKVNLLDYYSTSASLLSWLYKSWSNEKNKTIARKIKLGTALLLSIGWKHRRLKNFNNFRKKYTTIISTGANSKSTQSDLDTVICGSDQIWNPTITNGVNPFFFGEINGVKKRVSYAASMGKTALQPNEEEQIKKLVLDLDYCSVREENTAKYLSDLTGRDIQTVCDPVFLLEKEDYQAVATKPLIKQDYVLLYSVIHNDKLTSIAKQYADSHGLQLVEICSSKDKNSKHKQICTYGPSEFLSCFQHAKTIFTNSFHGTAFSIIFQKDFYIVDNKDGGSRIVNLLEKVDLLERLITHTVKQDFPSIDYVKSEKLLKEYVQFSKDFLEKSLKAEKESLAEKKCVSCGACKAVCRSDAIRLFNSKEGFLTSIIDKDKCVNCGLCRKVCPALNEVIKNDLESSTFAFKADDELRKNSTSGGAFAALAQEIIEQGGVFYGAKQTSDFSVVHVRGERQEDINVIQGTKYLPSDVTYCYELVAKDLTQEKTVLFSGTPCQIDAMLRYLDIKRISKERLYTVDIICHGVPSPSFYQSYLDWLQKKNGARLVEYKFRSKKVSWRGSSCYAKTVNGKELINDKNLCAFMNVYYSDNITRESCYSCPYTSKQRVSDLTISDYWGIENLDKSFEDKLGVSMILVNTEKGEKLFAKTAGEKIAGDIQTAKQPQLAKPTCRPSTREEFWKEYQQNGVESLLKQYGGIKRDSLKTVLYNIKKKILK